MSNYWLGVVSKVHVLQGVKLGIAQVCHGKMGPLSKMKAGDWLIYYSPKQSMESDLPCKSFTAIGRIKTGDVYQVQMFPGFNPFRVDVEYYECQEVSILSLMDKLEFTRKPSWGIILRRGLIPLTEVDYKIIAQAMLKNKT